MPDPFRLRVMKAVTAAIKSITPANGYISDLSDFVDAEGTTRARVFRGRDLFGASDGLPLVSILEDFRAPPVKVQSREGGKGINPFTILIQGFVKDDPDNPLDPAYLLEAEVRQAIVATNTRYDILGLGDVAPCVSEMTIGTPVCRPADNEVSTVAYFFLTVTLMLAEDLERPFA